MSNRIPSNTIVTPLDFSSVLPSAKLHIQKRNPDKIVEEASTHYDFGIVVCPRGVFILDADGVGCSEPITAENKATLPFYGKYSGGVIDVIPVLEWEVDDTTLKTLATLPGVPLEQFIKTFGRRNEANYEVWRETFEKERGA